MVAAQLGGRDAAREQRGEHRAGRGADHDVAVDRVDAEQILDRAQRADHPGVAEHAAAAEDEGPARPANGDSIAPSRPRTAARARTRQPPRPRSRGRRAATVARAAIQLGERLLDQLGQLIEVGHRVVVGVEAEVHAAVVGGDPDRERLARPIGTIG